MVGLSLGRKLHEVIVLNNAIVRCRCGWDVRTVDLSPPLRQDEVAVDVLLDHYNAHRQTHK